MANRKRAPKEVEDRHVALVSAAAQDLADKREQAWEAELVLRGRIRDAFEDDMTVGPIKAATVTPTLYPVGMSTPRLYQIKHGDKSELEVPA